MFFNSLPPFVHNMDGVGASLPQFPNGVPLSLGIHSETEREVFQILASLRLLTKVLTLWGASPVAPRLRPHTVFT